MQYQLLLTEFSNEVRRDAGENVFLDNLPYDYKVYVLYYPGFVPNEVLEDQLRIIGNSTGKNVFVNLGRLNDPNFDKIAKKFEIIDYPVIVVTAIDKLASTRTDDQFLTAYMKNYVKIDNKNLLMSVERITKSIERQCTLFLRGEVMEAITRSKYDQRDAMTDHFKNVISNTIKQIGKFLADRDIVVSLFEGKFELKPCYITDSR